MQARTEQAKKPSMEKAAGLRFSSQAPGWGPLTPLETEIATLIARGYRKREIAGMLAMKKREVKQHARQIFDKLGVDSRRELTGQVSYRN